LEKGQSAQSSTTEAQYEISGLGLGFRTFSSSSLASFISSVDRLYDISFDLTLISFKDYAINATPTSYHYHYDLFCEIFTVYEKRKKKEEEISN